MDFPANCYQPCLKLIANNNLYAVEIWRNNNLYAVDIWRTFINFVQETEVNLNQNTPSCLGHSADVVKCSCQPP